MASDSFLRPLFTAVVVFVAAFSPDATFSQTDPATELNLLLQLKRSLTNSDVALASWQPNSPPCGKPPGVPRWTGLRCRNGAVHTIRLEAMDLSGKIDIDALEKLPFLRSLSLANNSFAGPIPVFNRFSALKMLYLSSNKFSGEIPADYFENQAHLRKLWLDGNAFTGNIPTSLTKLNNLIELHLENNRFDGPVPPLDQKSLIDLDLSNNKLEGEVPAAMARFDARAFAGNEDLCGEKLGKKCKKEEPEHHDAPPQKPDQGARTKEIKRPRSDKAAEKNTGMFIAAISTLGAMVLSLVVVLVMRKVRGGEKAARPPSRRHGDSNVEVRVAAGLSAAGSSRRSGAAGTSRANTAAGKRRGGKGGMGDIVMLNDEKGSFGLLDLMNATAEVLGSAGVGSTYKANMAIGLSVVVKRMRDSNGRESDEFDMEAKRLGRLRHDNVLTPLAYYYRKDEKLFVYEYVPKGSLFYQLHGDHGGLSWPNRLKIVKGIAEGLNYLHNDLAPSVLPHGNLKSSNVLLGNDYNPLLSEFGFYPMFGAKVAAQMLVAYKAPEAIHDGTISPKCDVFCLGIIILEILSGKLPSLANNGKGGTDLVQRVGSVRAKGKLTELFDPEIGGSADSVGNMEELVRIAEACIETSPEDRLDMGEAFQRIEQVQP